MAEQMFFDQGGILVSQARFVVPGQTYAMQGVTSIQHIIEEPSKKGPIITMVIGIIVVLISFGVMSDSAGGGFVTLLIGAGIIAAAIFWLRSLKATHVVALTSAAGETRALFDTDAQRITQIVTALNDAIVARG